MACSHASPGMLPLSQSTDGEPRRFLAPWIHAQLTTLFITSSYFLGPVLPSYTRSSPTVLVLSAHCLFLVAYLALLVLPLSFCTFSEYVSRLSPALSLVVQFAAFLRSVLLVCLCACVFSSCLSLSLFSLASCCVSVSRLISFSLFYSPLKCGLCFISKLGSLWPPCVSLSLVPAPFV